MPTLTESMDILNSKSTIWLAYCSNTSRSVEECKSKTEEILNSASDEDRKFLSTQIGRQMYVLCMNRNSSSVIAPLFSIDNSELALGCVDAAINVASRGNEEVDANALIATYATRYGETHDFLVSKLRWLTIHSNYTANVAEVERIMGILENGGVA